MEKITSGVALPRVIFGVPTSDLRSNSITVDDSPLENVVYHSPDYMTVRMKLQ
jgi:hypothetical protein